MNNQETQALHDQLQDVNFLADKLRMTADVTAEDLNQEAARFSKANDMERAKADVFFTERTKKEKEVTELEAKIAQVG